MKAKITNCDNHAERLLGGILERTKAYVKNESFRKYNKGVVFNANELAGFISIAEYGNEEARKLALVTLYNLEDGHGRKTLKQGWGEYLYNFYRKFDKIENNPIQRELFQ